MASNRRQFLQHSLALAGGSLLMQSSLNAAERRQRLLIDGLGFPGSLTTQPGAALKPEEVASIASSQLCASHLTVGEVGSMPPLRAFEKIVRDIARWEGQIDQHPQVLSRIRQGEDIEQAFSEGRTGLIYGLQDGVAFEDDLGRLDSLHQLGVRIIQPTYNRRNLLGDGCMEPANAGLSKQGLLAVEKMNQLGILLDLSHCGRQTADDAIAHSLRPVSFTHTGCAALAEHPRHRSDEEIRQVAQGGGVTGIFVMPYLARGKQPTAADVIRHAEHALNVAGEDHVAIGTDGVLTPVTLTDDYKKAFAAQVRQRAKLGIAAPFETETGYLFASDLNTPDRFVTLAQKLSDSGQPGRVVDKVMGGNWMRLFSETWQTA